MNMAEARANGAPFRIVSIFSVKKGASPSAESEDAARGERGLRREEKV